MIDLEELKTRLKETYNQLNSQFSKGQIMVASFLVGVLVLGVGILYLKSRPTPVAIERSPILTKEKGGKQPPKLLVHVAGAVKKPDVYQFEKGDRIINAIKKAGAASPEADLDALNLASKLSDGQRIYLPRKGETPPSQEPSPYLNGSSGPFSNGSSSALLNLNTASLEQLDQLPGIGTVLAQRIIEYRAKKRFAQVDQLQEVEGIGPKKFSQIKGKVTVE